MGIPFVASLLRVNFSPTSPLLLRQTQTNGEPVELERVMVLGSNLHSLFNDSNEEAKLLALQLERLENYLL